MTTKRFVIAILLTATFLAARVSTEMNDGPRLVKDINDTFNFAASSQPSRVVEAGSIGFFAADDGVNGRELWRTDGTASGTILVKDIVPGPTGSLPDSSPQAAELTAVNDVVYFIADDRITGLELWRSDGTAEGTRLGAGSSSPRLFTAAGPNLFYAANDNRTGDELWTLARGALRRAFNLGESGDEETEASASAGSHRHACCSDVALSEQFFADEVDIEVATSMPTERD